VLVGASFRPAPVTIAGRDLSALTGAPKPATRPAADGSGARHRVIYTVDNGYFHEIAWRGGDAPVHDRLGAMRSEGRAALWLPPGESETRFAVRGMSDGHIYEVRTT
jgi:hypothetical protein